MQADTDSRNAYMAYLISLVKEKTDKEKRDRENSRPKIELRPYQKECVDILDRTESGRHLVALATGLGKTVIFSALKRQGRTLILSHRDELVRQPEKYYGCSYGIEKADEYSHGEEVVSASVQTLYSDKRLKRFAPDTFDTIIVDEAHHAAAPTYKKILSYFSGARRVFGFTATPKRGDNVRLDDVFDDIIFAHDLKWGIENKYLCNIRCKLVDGQYTLDGVRKTAGDYSAADLDKTVNHPETVALVAKVYFDECHKAKRQTLIYCVNRRSCTLMLTAIRALVPEDVKKIQMVTGETPPDRRRRILADFENGKVQCIINCMVLTEGTDLRHTSAIIDIRPSCNPSLYTQIVGRGTRLCEGKDACLVIDVIPSDGERRALCTAPTLLGVDPFLLPKEDRKKFDGKDDLTELCDLLKGHVQDIAKQLEYKIENINRLVSEEELRLNSAANTKDFVASGAPWSKERAEDTVDAGGLFLHRNADDEMAYAVYPSFFQRIYFSKPDVLGKTVVRFHTDAMPRYGIPGGCFVGELPWEEAVSLVRKYCMLQPEYCRYCWDKRATLAWKGLPCTEPQAKRIQRDLKKYSLDPSDAPELSKLDASLMIDHIAAIREQKKFLNAYGFTERSASTTKERRVEAFKKYDAESKKQEKQGMEKFQLFREKVLAAYKGVEEQKQKEAEEEEQAQKAGAYAVSIVAYGGTGLPQSEKQENFLRSLLAATKVMGYLLPGSLDCSKLDRMQSSCLISVLKKIQDSLPIRKDEAVICGLEEIFDKAKEITYGSFLAEFRLGAAGTGSVPEEEKM